MPISTLEELPLVPSPKTSVWFSAAALKAFDEFRGNDSRGIFLKKLRWACQVGFAACETGKSPVLAAEGNGVFRFGVKDSLFRLIGFYEDATKASFLFFDGFTKSGQSLSGPQRARIAGVANIRAGKAWKKKVDDGDYPRLAKGT